MAKPSMVDSDSSSATESSTVSGSKSILVSAEREARLDRQRRSGWLQLALEVDVRHRRRGIVDRNEQIDQLRRGVHLEERLAGAEVGLDGLDRRTDVADSHR